MQKASNHLMSAKFPDLYASAFHVPNGEMRPVRTIVRKGRTFTYSPAGKKLKDMGAKPGIPDWLILHPLHHYHGVAIELKTKGGSLQESQKQVLENLENQGYFVAVCWSLDGFEKALQDYWLPF